MRTVTRTIRIDEDIDQNLTTLAERENFSVNQLVSTALRRYLEWELVADKVSLVDVSNSTLTKLFEKISEQDARQMGRAAGMNAWTEVVTYLYKSLTYDNILRMLELRGHYGRGFIFEQSSDNTGDILIVKHRQGKNSTAFLAEAIGQLLKKVQVKFEVSETEDQIVIHTFKPWKPLKESNHNSEKKIAVAKSTIQM
jgi:hypothetical protein